MSRLYDTEMILGLTLRFLNLHAEPDLIDSFSSFRLIKSIERVDVSGDANEGALAKICTKVSLKDGSEFNFDGYGVSTLRACEDVVSRAVVAIALEQKQK